MGFAQIKRQSLIVAEYRIDTPKLGNYTYVVSYNFDNGKLVSKDTILGAQSHYKYSIFKFGFGNHFIYKNRFAISGSGNVIDTKTKKLMTENYSDDFIAAAGDTLIFHRSNTYTGTGYLMLNLLTGSYNFFNHQRENREREQRSSPDKKFYLSISRSSIPYKINLCDTANNKTLLVKDAKHGPNCEFATVETAWLDNNSFLYAVHETKFSSNQTEFSKITLRCFDIKNNSDTVFCILDSVGKAFINGKFYLDKIGQMIYRAPDWKSYVVEIKKAKLTEYSFHELGNQFSLSYRSAKKGWRVKYKNIDLGVHWGSTAETGDGIIGMEYGKVGSNLGYPAGIKVWSELTNKWQKINIPWTAAIVGWIEMVEPGK
jgi:hypothetical protein